MNTFACPGFFIYYSCHIEWSVEIVHQFSHQVTTCCARMNNVYCGCLENGQSI